MPAGSLVPTPVRLSVAVVLLLLAATPVAALESCFPDEGHRLGIGTEGPHIDLLVHTSLVTNLGGEGVLGLEAVGTTGRSEIVTLRAGVVFAGVGDPTDFLDDPFGHFALAFDYRFRLPMFGSEFDYRADESPVTGVPSADCGFVPPVGA
jgi:hypothetical protein